jgi:hypothetical protein
MQLMQPDIRPQSESGALYRLNDPYVFFLGMEKIVIPTGYRYDGASYAALLFQRDGIHRAAALVHDFLYENKGHVQGVTYNRLAADEAFKRLLKLCGVKNWHVAVAYFAVRAFGWLYWRKGT